MFALRCECLVIFPKYLFIIVTIFPSSLIISFSCTSNILRAILNYAMSHNEPLWVTMTQNIGTTTHYDPIVNRIQCHDPKKDKRSPFTYLILSQKYLIRSQNLKMLCLKRNLAFVCIRSCWLRMWVIVFRNFGPSTFFGPIWSQILKMICFKWNLARVCIRGCWLPFW